MFGEVFAVEKSVDCFSKSLWFYCEQVYGECNIIKWNLGGWHWKYAKFNCNGNICVSQEEMEMKSNTLQFST